jgi:hypothetical protein
MMLDEDRNGVEAPSHPQGGSPFGNDRRLQDLKILSEKCRRKVDEISSAIKRAASGNGPSSEVAKLQDELKTLHDLLGVELKRLQEEAGIPDEIIELAEKSRLPRLEQRYSLRDILDVSSTDDLDEFAARGVERLLSLQHPAWLRSQSKMAYRLGTDFMTSPLQLVGGTRMPRELRAGGPQRFAQMLLTCLDHLGKRDDLDFFAASMLVPEVAMLGCGLDEIVELGPEATSKLGRLPTMTDAEVCSSVYELLVGAACVRRGMRIEMLRPDRSKKTPDFRVHSVGVPAVVECKRRHGLTEYEAREARHVATLYDAIRPFLSDRALHVSIEVKFSAEVFDVRPGSFREEVTGMLQNGVEGHEKELRWGSITFGSLRYIHQFPLTRLFSPMYLDRIFDWFHGREEWDGIICEAESPPAILLCTAKSPRCLKWASLSDKAVLKKSRGVTSLWGEAVRQIPDGELGFVYIAYTEGARPQLADARTRYIMDRCHEWYHRWSVMVPLTVINRVYPLSKGPGMPDLVENAIPMAAEGDESYLATFPTLVFVPRPHNSG